MKAIDRANGIGEWIEAHVSHISRLALKSFVLGHIEAAEREAAEDAILFAYANYGIRPIGLSDVIYEKSVNEIIAAHRKHREAKQT